MHDLLVPSAYTFPLAPQFEPNKHYASTLYRVPMLAATVLASIAPTAIAIGSAVFARSPLERLFRDSQVVRQHGFAAASRYETTAQVLLGIEPDLPLSYF